METSILAREFISETRSGLMPEKTLQTKNDLLGWYNVIVNFS
jgi:hypothetical protein